MQKRKKSIFFFIKRWRNNIFLVTRAQSIFRFSKLRKFLQCDEVCCLFNHNEQHAKEQVIY